MEDQSLIIKLYGDAFYNIIKNLDYEAIIKLCSTSKRYQQYCDDNNVWSYLLKRDFYPLLQFDVDSLNPKNLYYTIQTTNIRPAKELYKQYEKWALIALCNNTQQNYYGARWLLKEKNLDPMVNFDNHLTIHVPFQAVNALKVACYYGHLEIVKLLLQNNQVDPRAIRNGPFISACIRGRLEVVKLLLTDTRVNPGDQNSFALVAACEKNQVEVVKLLLADKRADPSASNNEAIQLASEYGHVEVVKLLLDDPRVDPGDQYNHTIIRASERGRIEVVKLLLTDTRVDPGGRNNRAIQRASAKGHVEVVKLLLADKRRRVDPGDRNNDAIQLASEYGHVEVVKLLLDDPRVDPSDENNNAIKYASRNGHVEVVKLLLDDPRVQKTLTVKQLEKIQKKNYIVQSCIGCLIGVPLFHEQHDASRRFCSSYCQLIHYGMTPAQIEKALALAK